MFFDHKKCNFRSNLKSKIYLDQENNSLYYTIIRFKIMSLIEILEQLLLDLKISLCKGFSENNLLQTGENFF